MAKGLDEIDLKILNHLQKKGRAQRNQLAEIVHLSVPSVSERMRKLEEKNLITGYRAILDPKLFKFDITAFVFVEVEGSDNYKDFIELVEDETEVLECHSITGDGSHILKIRTENTDSFETLLSRIQGLDGVSKSRSNVVLSSFKETTNLPVNKTIDPK